MSPDDAMMAEHRAVSPALSLSRVERAALLAACTDDRFDAQSLGTPIARIIRSAPEYPALLAAARVGADPFATGVPLPAALLEEPVVLAALPRVVICAPEIERILTMLRRLALLGATSAEVPSLAAQPLPRPFLSALAGAAYLAEFAWLIEADEAERLETVRSMLSDVLISPDRDPADAEDLFLLAALYGPLGKLPGAELLATLPEERWSQPFVGVIREQVLEPLVERTLAADLPTLTPIADATSRAVQRMYEEHPYPRWRTVSFRGSETLADRFRRLCPGEPVPNWPSPLPVLVAGAGTGKHPIETARRLSEADVLALDLSRASLAYGARMADRLGVRNVRFGQADILALDALDERFALIECGGVLHHLADPLAGWGVLRRLLRPDGLMRIALYSERARLGVVAARELLARDGASGTPDGIRAARRRLLDLPSGDPAATLTRFREFYSASGFRDLAMHVQEHRFTIPQLADALDRLELRFLGFQVSAEVRHRFRARFPAPGAELDLTHWDRFEADMPDTFLSMYVLWCRPR
jgi:SAM-dependent methyltransferase